MSADRNGKRPLVADRRYPKNERAKAPKRSGGGPGGGSGGGSGRGRGGRPSRRPSGKRPQRRGGPIGLLMALIRFVLGLIWSVTWRLSAVVIVLIALGVGYFYTTLPPANQLLDGRTRGSVTMLDRNNKVFAWRGEQYGGTITAADASPYLRDAIIATEDKRFYHHFGVDPIGIASAIKINLSAGRGPLSGNGGSTITQQTAKLLCAGRPYDPNKWKNQADYEADCRTTTLWRKIQRSGLRDGDGGQVHQGPDPDDLHEPGLPGCRGQRFRGGGRALFRQVGLGPDARPRRRCWRAC